LSIPYNRRVAADSSLGVRWYRLAAEAGDVIAQRDLGYCLHEGVGVAVDFREAVGWYRKAAEQGDRKAQFNLGLCYLEGDGVVRSLRWARYWLQKAAVLLGGQGGWKFETDAYV
jgi:TPR repeat protein